jgi:hypothetical protein
MFWEEPTFECGEALRMGMSPEVGSRCRTNKLFSSLDSDVDSGMGHNPKQLPSRLGLVKTLYQPPGSKSKQPGTIVLEPA